MELQLVLCKKKVISLKIWLKEWFHLLNLLRIPCLSSKKLHSLRSKDSPSLWFHTRIRTITEEEVKRLFYRNKNRGSIPLLYSSNQICSQTTQRNLHKFQWTSQKIWGDTGCRKKSTIWVFSSNRCLQKQVLAAETIKDRNRIRKKCKNLKSWIRQRSHLQHSHREHC